ncbi:MULTISPECIES: ketoacyl-ACP synthase III [unclassified Flavobacterium]|uniref:ketoacyl-ACP synthase III n=1 Tax=unclassified Flavobacterium TaxID=196869 RepID=UPI0036172F5A
MYQEFQGVEIKAVASCVPKNKVGNDSFSHLLSSKELRIFEKTVGILERRWADKEITASDLGYAAAINLFEKSRVNLEEIECLVFLSQTPDFKLPFTSNILQQRLGLKQNILCLDINAGCAGFVQGLSVSYSIAKSLDKGKVLFIVAETLSKILSESDRSTTPLFGDGASAVLIENTGNAKCKSYFNFYSDGGNADAIQIPDGGCRNGTTQDSLSLIEDEKGNTRSKLHLSMDGPRVFDFTLREIAPSIESLLKDSAVDRMSVDYFLFHQSNQFIIKQITSQLSVDSEKVLLNISEFGNTSGVSIPLLFSSYPKKFGTSKTLLLSGYGVGLNWGNCILENTSFDSFEKIEI